MFAELLERLARALDQAHLPYMVIGGQAVLLYGEPQLTRDIDITLGVGVDRQTDVLSATANLDLEPLVDPETFTEQTMVLPCLDSTTGIRTDFIFSFTPYERQAIDRAALIPIGETPVRFPTAEDLIVHKMLAGRPRDHDDVSGILLKQPTLDLVYVRQCLTELAASTNQPLIDQFDALVSNARWNSTENDPEPEVQTSGRKVGKEIQKSWEIQPHTHILTQHIPMPFEAPDGSLSVIRVLKG